MADQTAQYAVGFGPFCLFPAQRILLEDGKQVRLGSRALAVLIALVERAGGLISKDELIARVWPKTYVEEGALRVQIAGLRRVLGDGQAGRRYIGNVPGQGYCFVAPVQPLPAEPPTTQPEAIAHNLRPSLTRMVGRDGAAKALSTRLPQQRFITVTGAGGIGKTTVVSAVAQNLIASYRDGGCFVDLAAIADSSLVTTAVASTLGLPAGAQTRELVGFSRDKQLLLVFDSCDHVIDAAASLAAEVVGVAPAVNIMATSREPLRSEGEFVYPLRPLEVPPVTATLNAAEALAFPAVQLFVERAAACLGEFDLSDADAAAVAGICRMLDGIPLAIELAAGRVDAFGIHGLLDALDNRLDVLTRGTRTAAPRHQTLSATLDWTYDYLPGSERMVLRRLAVFADYFTLDSAREVILDDESLRPKVVEDVANLVMKSLVTVDVSAEVVLYRLLETTRAYARAKLVESGEFEMVADRYAEYIRGMLKRAGLGPDGSPLAVR